MLREVAFGKEEKKKKQNKSCLDLLSDRSRAQLKSLVYSGVFRCLKQQLVANGKCVSVQIDL